MEQQTDQVQSTLTFAPHHKQRSSIIQNTKQMSAYLLRSTLTRKLQELFSISFRKIVVNYRSRSISRIKITQRNKSRINQSDRKPPSIRQKSQTQRLSSSTHLILDDLMTFSEGVKIVLTQINKYDKLSQIMDSSKRIEQVVSIQSKRLDRIKNKDRFKEKTKTYDTITAINCIQKLLRFISQFCLGNIEVVNLKSQIQSLKNKLECNRKNSKDKFDNLKENQNFKSIDVLLTIIKDHKIQNIKRKLSQQSKKLTQTQKQLFQGILTTISKAQASYQTKFNQINQLYCKLLQEQPTWEKNINHIQKQKRVFEKILAETKGQQNKATYYNLIDTSIYLVKLFNNIQQKQKSNISLKTSRIKEPLTSRSNTKSNQKSSRIRTRIQECQIQPSESKILQDSHVIQKNQKKQQPNMFLQQFSSTIQHLTSLQQNYLNDNIQIDLINNYPIKIQDNKELRKIIQIVNNIIEFGNKQKSKMIETIKILTIDNQYQKQKQNSLEKNVKDTQLKQEQLRNILEQIQILLFKSAENFDQTSIVSKIKQMIFQKQSQQLSSQHCHNLCREYLSTFTFPLTSLPKASKQLVHLFPSIANLQREMARIISENMNHRQKYLQLQQQFDQNHNIFMRSHQEQIQNKCNQIGYLKNTIENLSQQVFSLRKQISNDNGEVNNLKIQIDMLKRQNDQNTTKLQDIIQNLYADLDEVNRQRLMIGDKLQGTVKECEKIIEGVKEKHKQQKYSLELKIKELRERQKQILKNNTILQNDIFVYKREIDQLKKQSNKIKGQTIKQQVVENLREENALLRNDVIRKGQMIQRFEEQLSPKIIKNNLSPPPKKKVQEDYYTTVYSNNMNKQIQPFNQQSFVNQSNRHNSSTHQNQTIVLKQKIRLLGLQRSRDQAAIDDLRKQINQKSFQINIKNYETVKQSRIKQSYQDYNVQDSYLNHNKSIIATDNYYSYNSPLKKQIPSTYQFVTKKFSSNPFRGISSVTSSPKPVNNRIQNQIKQYEKMRLLSVFTIIDDQNKAFVHNINKVINCLLEYLSCAKQFSEYDYTNIDFITNLSQYLFNQDYEGYFEALQQFFKDLFLNIFDRKNAILSKQSDQLLFFKNKMSQMLSQKIDEIQIQQQKLCYAQRSPFKNYNEDIPHLQHLFKLFIKNNDLIVLKQICQILNVQ